MGYFKVLYPGIHLEELWKTIKNLSKHLVPSQDFNLGPPNCKSDMLLLQQQVRLQMHLLYNA
jgi:hypothetical protein